MIDRASRTMVCVALFLAPVACGNSSKPNPSPTPSAPSPPPSPSPSAAPSPPPDTLVAKDRRAADEPPPPPEEEDDDDDSGGAGTAMALEEGKMGTMAYEEARRAAREGDDTAAGGAAGAGRAAAIPKVTPGALSVTGDADKAELRRFVDRVRPKLLYCYESALLGKPDLKGTVSTTFFIGPSGSVMSSTAAGVDPVVSSCVADVFRAIVFPKPRGGGGVQVTYTHTFEPPAVGKCFFQPLLRAMFH